MAEEEQAMGCSGSSGTKSRVASGYGPDTLDTFLRLDHDIWREEKAAPAPSLGHCIAQLEKVNREIESISRLHISPVSEPADTLLIQSQYKWNADSAEEAIQRALVELQINQNPKNAIEHEEFIANLTRQALRQSRLGWLRQRKQDTEDEINMLSERVQHLQDLYEQLDSLISAVAGSALSDLELQLDRVRSYRDTLYSGELLWREAARLTQTATTLAKAGRDGWLSLDNTTNVVTRFRVATDCRNAIHQAALCIQTAQTTLSGVMFLFCTPREMAALLQVIDYIYTDLQIPERFNHALEVYTGFQRRAALLSNWIRQMMEDTIKKDVQDVDQRILELAAKLSNERASIIRHKIGMRMRTGNRHDAFSYPNGNLPVELPRKPVENSPWMAKKVDKTIPETTEYNALMWK